MARNKVPVIGDNCPLPIIGVVFDENGIIKIKCTFERFIGSILLPTQSTVTKLT